MVTDADHRSESPCARGFFSGDRSTSNPVRSEQTGCFHLINWVKHSQNAGRGERRCSCGQDAVLARSSAGPALLKAWFFARGREGDLELLCNGTLALTAATIPSFRKRSSTHPPHFGAGRAPRLAGEAPDRCPEIM